MIEEDSRMLKHTEEKDSQQKTSLFENATQANLVLCMLIFLKNEIGKSIKIKCSVDFKCQISTCFSLSEEQETGTY